ncbi:response regulator transcription factor [Burkholderia ubonensis]|uniref:response regulator transcription factor n=1 Tax=Burkholderia ubonensis TaxID=101571 RepID=UPI000BA64F10|nr:response regulator transcription factor [Burkholderia ubonensis]PAJ86080.1 DNA-binding response regulator [Burkholderia ubonensis]PAJ93045.1 DNA-binding response regulator [Burkholderia ubonensis]PAK05589.1 DNA-binding response regulator [Burkholderia ubonensis]PAK11639.1 DNA-binding response regulator [Burkholderia ubonensis]RQP68300.1 DNA-binding response regulator [Burkholderia ubonensis]
MTSVLLVDDDVELTGMLVQYLAHEGFAATVAHDGEAGVASALTGDFAIVVLDVMMPRVSGIDALRRIRAASRVPVLMLTARGDDIDRISGLNLGADDYVPKPCTPGELVARLRAILRRASSMGEACAGLPLQAGSLVLWPSSRRATWQGEPLELTGAEFNLLEILTRHAGRLVSKTDISLQAFGRPLARFDRRIDVHISSIRQKLGQRPDGQPWIISVRGMGYQLLTG